MSDLGHQTATPDQACGYGGAGPRAPHAVDARDEIAASAQGQHSADAAGAPVQECVLETRPGDADLLLWGAGSSGTVDGAECEAQRYQDWRKPDKRRPLTVRSGATKS
jgi:hypothetical protein